MLKVNRIITKINNMSTLYHNLTSVNQFHSSRLKGKVAVVTASSDGIGLAIAKRLGNEGASVVISSRKEENVNGAITSLHKDGISVEGIVCHVSNVDHRKKLFELEIKCRDEQVVRLMVSFTRSSLRDIQEEHSRAYTLQFGGRIFVKTVAKSKFGGIDILVSNAAVNPAVSPVLETDENVWDKIFEVNVKSSWLLAKEAYPELIKRGGGSIVFVASIAGYQPMEPLGPYSISKTTLLGMTKAIAYEVVHDNIRVNCVAPGIVATKFASAITSSEAAKDRSLAIVPMKRFGKPDEIASAVAFLVSDDASYVTGETLVVAGGTYAHL